MNKHFSLLAVIILLNACVAGGVKAPADKVNAMRHIAVVPMESPPLVFALGVSSAQFYSQSVAFSTYSDPAYQTGGQVGMLIFGIFMLAELPEAAKHSEKVSASLDEMLSSKEVWIPTVILAEEVAEQIGPRREVTVVTEIQMIPGIENRGYTWSGENYAGPTREWYVQDISPFDYSELNKQGVDGVLEVGLHNYVLSSVDVFHLQMLIKLVDPKTGKVLGRASAIDTTWGIKKHKELFDNDGIRFKELVASVGQELVAENLKEIGLLHE